MSELSLLENLLDPECYREKLDDNEHVVSLELSDNYDETFDFDGSLINALAQFRFLKELSIEVSYFAITDLSGLSELSNLETLVLTNCCKTADISVLSTLQNLTYLKITGAEIIDISPLRTLKKLQQINLAENHISNIGALANHPDLINVILTSNELIEVSALAGSEKLKALYLDNNRINDLSFISELNQLETLSLNNNHLTTLDFLRCLPSIKYLSFDDNPVGDITPLSVLSDLQHLSMLNLMIENLAPIQFASNLTNLSAGPVRQFDATIISQLTELAALRLEYCDINNLAFLRPLKKLASLNLSNNKIDDGAILTKFGELIDLSLQNNKIHIPFDCLPLYKLRKLDLRGNVFGNKLYDHLHVGFYVEKLNQDIATYWFEHENYDKALGYYYAEKLSKPTLIICHKKLLTIAPEDKYFRFYYVARCREIIESIKEPDQEVLDIRADVINIVKNSDFFSKELLLANLEDPKVFVHVIYINNYSNYLNSGKITRPHPEMFYYICKKSLNSEQGLEKLLYLYKELLKLGSHLSVGVFYIAKNILESRFANTPQERELYNYYKDILLNAMEREVPAFDLAPWLHQNFGRYAIKKPNPTVKPGPVERTYPEVSIWKILSPILLLLFVLLNMLRGCK